MEAGSETHHGGLPMEADFRIFRWRTRTVHVDFGSRRGERELPCGCVKLERNPRFVDHHRSKMDFRAFFGYGCVTTVYVVVVCCCCCCVLLTSLMVVVCCWRP